MSHLQLAVYQLVHDRSLLAEAIENSQLLLQRFGLAPAEAQAVLSVLGDSEQRSRLLSTESVHKIVDDLLDGAVWVPPFP